MILRFNKLPHPRLARSVVRQAEKEGGKGEKLINAVVWPGATIVFIHIYPFAA